jgi:uncharacterized protein YaiI (UPF0178 family)
MSGSGGGSAPVTDGAPAAARPDIYVDADACPVRDEVVRVAERLALRAFFVSNGARPIAPPRSLAVTLIRVDLGSDKADDWIVERIAAADVCVTGDIPLASRCLKKGAYAVAPNGKAWTDANIGSALAGRAIAQHRRELGETTGGPPPFTRADRSRFLQALDTALQAALRQRAKRG